MLRLVKHDGDVFLSTSVEASAHDIGGDNPRIMIRVLVHRYWDMDSLIAWNDAQGRYGTREQDQASVIYKGKDGKENGYILKHPNLRSILSLYGPTYGNPQDDFAYVAVETDGKILISDSWISPEGHPAPSRDTIVNTALSRTFTIELPRASRQGTVPVGAAYMQGGIPLGGFVLKWSYDHTEKTIDLSWSRSDKQSARLHKAYWGPDFKPKGLRWGMAWWQTHVYDDRTAVRK